MEVLLTASGFEQGSFNTSGNVDSKVKIRTINYLPFDNDTSNLSTVTLTITAPDASKLQIYIAGYKSGDSFVRVGYKGYNTTPVTLNLKDFPDMQYYRLAIKKKDGSNITTADIESVKIDSICYWEMTDKGADTDYFIDCYSEYMGKPYPYAIWRLDDTIVGDLTFEDGGAAYHLLLPELISYRYEPLNQNPYVTVHNYDTNQNDFNNNGLAVLTPVSCDINEELNGEYSLDYEGIIDDMGKWTYIKEMNYIKALGQIFRINKVNTSYNGNKGKVTATAFHVFYAMNDLALYPGGRLVFYPNGVPDGATTKMEYLLESIFRTTLKIGVKDGQKFYNYSYSSDIVNVSSAVANEKWGKLGSLEGKSSPTNLIMNSDGLISNFGGELYRNNFYFSINQRREHAVDNAFDIRIGKNLKGIQRVIDTSTWFTYLIVYNNHGERIETSYTDVIFSNVRQNIIKIVKYNQDEPNIELLNQYSEKLWWENATPLVSYKVNIQEVTENKDFIDYADKPSYNVGDSGVIYDERLGINIKLKITKTKKDGKTGKIKDVTFGATHAFVNNSNAKVIELDIPITKEYLYPIKDVNGFELQTADGYILYGKGEIIG